MPAARRLYPGVSRFTPINFKLLEKFNLNYKLVKLILITIPRRPSRLNRFKKFGKFVELPKQGSNSWMDQAPIVVPRGFKGVLATEIWSEMGVGFGLLVELGKAARYRNGDKAERRGIGRILGGIEGVWRNAGYNRRGVEGIMVIRSMGENY